MCPGVPIVKTWRDVSCTVESRVLETRIRARFEGVVGFQAKSPEFGNAEAMVVNVAPPSRLTETSTKSTSPMVRHSMTSPPFTRTFSKPLGERSCKVGAGEREACTVFPSKPRLILPPFGLDSLLKGDVRSPESMAGEFAASAAKIPACQLPTLDDRWKSSSVPIVETVA